jgi:peroxiredoxin
VQTQPELAPELRTTAWLNTDAPISLAALRGKIVVLHAFQMLCPGCVSHGIPQAQRIFESFDAAHVTVLGLHTVFEHHAVMNEQALRAFVHEYRLRFPIGIDQPDGRADIPLTMRAYGMRGTPSLVIIDQRGFVRLHRFGQVSDLEVGAVIGTLLQQAVAGNAQSAAAGAGCDEDQCAK